MTDHDTTADGTGASSRILDIIDRLGRLRDEIAFLAVALSDADAFNDPRAASGAQLVGYRLAEDAERISLDLSDIRMEIAR